MNDCEKCEAASTILKTWLNKQGHNRCWYYPDVFNQLIDLFGITPTVEPALPLLEEFKQGCEQFQKEEYKG